MGLGLQDFPVYHTVKDGFRRLAVPIAYSVTGRLNHKAFALAYAP